MVASACLDDATVARLANDEVSSSERLEILAHADGCEDCRALLVAIAQRSGERTERAADETLLGSGVTERRRAHPRPGDVIDHYTVVDVLGHGAMGLVVRARDSDLGRDVALKLLIHAGSEDAERRLVREAQAMAQLSHPNVVTVHAVGRYRDGVYIAMELVVGQTLGSWCEAEPRSWVEIVRIFLAAAEGLAAAHAADLVHRDFKPDNVLVGEDGQVLVSDFGLAGVTETFSSDGLDSLELGTNLTRTGVLMGTPRYMAPEQHQGRRDVDARADQFAFGVALYHALYRRYPFEGNDMESLRTSVSSGIPVSPPPRADVPRAVWQALQRCIQRDPDRRYPGMRPLIRDLRRVLDAPARRRRMLGLGVAGALVLGGGLALGLGLGDARAPRPCAKIEERLGGVWSEDRAREVAKALASARDVEAGTETAVRLQSRLDEYAAAWIEDARETCEATHVHGVQPLAQLEAHTQCLDERRVALDALVTQLVARPADEVIERAVSAAAALPSIEACGDRRPGLEKLAPAVQAELARLSTMLSLGAYDDVEREAVVLDPQVQQPRARAELLVTRGRAASWQGRSDHAAELLRAAELAAAEAGDDFLLAVVRIELLKVLAMGQARYESADILVDTARVALRRVGEPLSLRRRLATYHASILLARESYSEAMRQIDIALAAVDEQGGDELARSRVLQQRAVALAALDREDEALEDATRVLESRRELLGEHHPSVPEAQQNLARVLLVSGRPREAEVQLEEVLQAIERQGGPNALAAAEVEMMLAGAVLNEDPSRGIRHAERSLEILVHHGRGESQHAFSVRNMIGIGYSNQGRHEDAIRIFAETVEAREQAGNADDPAFAYDLHHYAEALTRGGRCDEAIQVLQRMQASAGEESHLVAAGLIGEGICHLDLDRPGAAPLFERALASGSKVPLDAYDRSLATFGLARARWRSGARRGAIALAEEGLGYAREADDEELRASIEEWLAEHRAG